MFLFGMEVHQVTQHGERHLAYQNRQSFMSSVIYELVDVTIKTTSAKARPIW